MASSSVPKARSAGKGVVVWEWFDEHGKWKPYSPEVVAYIDKEGTSRPVRRVVYPALSPLAQQVLWEFEGDGAGEWVAYDTHISAGLEHAHQSGQQMLDMASLFQLPYSIHFTTMQQVRMNTGRTRKIRRSLLQTPYPSAAKLPKCFSKLTTVLPDSSFSFSSTSHSGTSTSAGQLTNGSAASSSKVSSTSALGLTRGMSITKARPWSSSDSDSDSDPFSGMTLRAKKPRLQRKVKRTQGHLASATATSTGGVGAGLQGSGAGPSNIASSSRSGQIVSSASSGVLPAMSSPQMSAMQPQQLGSNPGPSPSYAIPPVSLVNVGPTVSVSLASYAQPLGAHLTRGFPPMTHIPPAHSHNPLQHHAQLGPLTQPTPSSHSLGRSASHSSPVVAHSTPSSSSSQQPGVGGHGHSQGLGQGLAVSSSQALGLLGLSVSSSSVNPPSALPHHSSGNWLGVNIAAAGAMVSSAGAVSHSHTHMQGILGSSQLASSSLQMASQHAQSGPGSGLSYQGPLTRNRMLKQQMVGHVGVGGGGGGMLVGGRSGGTAGGSGINGVHPNLSQIPHSYAIPHQHPHSLHATSVSGPTSTSTHIIRQYHQPTHTSHHALQLQQVQQQQQQLHGLGSGHGYPFNLPSFVPSIGINLLPQSGLLLSGQVSSRSGRSVSSQQSDPVTETLPTETKIVLPRQKKTKRKSKTGEEVLTKYMESIAPQENEDCCICCEPLTGPSSYGEGRPGQMDVIQLNKCSHMFHRLCLLAMYDSSHNGDSLQCPTCKTIYGELTGNCPPGEMSYDILSRPLPSYHHCGTIRVSYYISPGIQGQEHPNPGQRFTARGFPRSGFLPDDNRGRKILKMLMMAFKRKLMFTIGTSATTGESDTVVWNEIHHKTEFGSNVSGHGYPDPNYLDNVTAELALKGVTELDI